jgi:hypothetical protein
MPGRMTVILCDVCGREVPDRACKEIVYQLNKTRYRLELCPNCLDDEMKRLDEPRGIPGFRKRAAIAFTIDSVSDLPRQPTPA